MIPCCFNKNEGQALVRIHPRGRTFHPTVDGAAEGPDASLRFCVVCLLDLFPFLQDITFRSCSSAVDSFVFCTATSSFLLHLSSFLICFKDTLTTKLRNVRFSANSCLRIILLVHKYHFLSVSLAFFRATWEQTLLWQNTDMQEPKDPN